MGPNLTPHMPRGQDTAELLYEMMRGFYLPDPKTVAEQQVWRARRRRNMANAGRDDFASFSPNNSTGEQQKGPRIFQATRRMPLSSAFAALGIEESWFAGFRESGEHYRAIRLKWRHDVLRYHPDRNAGRPDQAHHPSPITHHLSLVHSFTHSLVPHHSSHTGLSDEKQELNTAEYMKAMAAFDSIDTYFASHFANVAMASTSAASTSSGPNYHAHPAADRPIGGPTGRSTRGAGAEAAAPLAAATVASALEASPGVDLSGGGADGGVGSGRAHRSQARTAPRQVALVFVACLRATC